MLNKTTSIWKKKIINKPTIDLSSMHSSEIFEKYWFCSIWDFKEWFAPFAKMKGKKRFEWWISSWGQVLADWFKSCWLFAWWAANFTKIDWTQWWISTNWEILKDNVEYVYPFEDKHWIYVNNDQKLWVINEYWKVIIEWLDKVIRISNTWFWSIQAEIGEMRIDIFLYKTEWSKFYVFRDNNNQWQGWISTDCKQIFPNKKQRSPKYFSKCYPFGNEIKGYWQFIDWNNSWFIWSDWSISDIKRVLGINNQLITEQWFKCLSLLKWDKTDRIYIDREWRLWDDVQERWEVIYVKKDWKEYNRKLIK